MDLAWVSLIFVEEMHLCSEGNNCIWGTAVTLQNSIYPHVWSSPGPFHRSRLMSGPPENTEVLWPALTLSACHHDVRCLWCQYIMVWKGCPWMGASVLSCHCPFQKQDIAAWLQFYPGWLAPFWGHILWAAESVSTSAFFIYIFKWGQNYEWKKDESFLHVLYSSFLNTLSGVRFIFRDIAIKRMFLKANFLGSNV